ncbi:helix-turn-helix domain-containing protein [Streptomyces sp. PTM05]|uniref:Helix-turn-helix domain-containing protein n=1 Tax=Streptantibioticus parmotrematis TaxID=2873249 RepID=A0ABS7QVK9_9ACTN|nr:helix-turn-helix domain-containing protein [Streptantibioticus parmotrematis]MBY8886699.1 helix-turn-helix domain-containing protein [Streptantibioticus parmotrematis]
MERTPQGPRRRAVLDALREADGPLGVTEIAGRLGVHPNTARFHLDALVAEGAAHRTVQEPSGPGRPRTVYAPRPGMDRGGVRGYRLLARILLGRLAVEGEAAPEEARRAGLAWGGFLVERPPPGRRLTAGQATDRLTGLLADLGFEPERAGPDVVRLRHCPFLELAEEYGQIVCSVHLGMMQGALEELGGEVTATGLEPFAEPDACLARLAESSRKGSRRA